MIVPSNRVLAAATTALLGAGLWALPVVGGDGGDLGRRSVAEAEVVDTAPQPSTEVRSEGITADGGDEQERRPTIELTGYTSPDDCSSLETAVRRRVRDAVTPWGLGSSVHLTGGFAVPGGAAPEMAADGAAGGATSGGSPAQPAPAQGSGEHSGTTVVVEGVDEGDVMDHDGEHLFTLGTSGRIVHVVEMDPDAPAEVATIQVPSADGQLVDASMLLVGERLVVTRTSADGLDVDTVVSIHDVSDPTQPVATPVATHEIDGVVVGARAVDDDVRLVVRHPLAGGLPFVAPLRSDDSRARDLAQETNRALVEDASLVELVGSITTTAGDTESTVALAPCESSHVLTADELEPDTELTTILRFDVAAPAELRRTTVDARATRVHVTPDHVLLAEPNLLRTDPGLTVGTTRLVLFDLDDSGSIRPVAEGEIPGRVNEDFAFDLRDGRIRVVTQEIDASRLTVLEVDGGELVEVGALDDIGVGERHFGIRFLGDLAYVITFEIIDPLHVIDLSDPTRPRLRGELEVPGFSQFLVPLTDDVLLGVGQDAGNAVVALFDVSDPDRPRELDRTSAGGEGRRWRVPIDDHKAMTWWADERRLSVSLTDGSVWSAEVSGVDDAPATLAVRDLGRMVPTWERAAPWCDDGLARNARVGSTLWGIGQHGVVSASADRPDEPRASLVLESTDSHLCSWWSGRSGGWAVGWW